MTTGPLLAYLRIMSDESRTGELLEPPSERAGGVAELVRQLHNEHARLEARIEELNRCLYLGVREQMERKRLQKLKLLTRDRLAVLEKR